MGRQRSPDCVCRSSCAVISRGQVRLKRRSSTPAHRLSAAHRNRHRGFADSGYRVWPGILLGDRTSPPGVDRDLAGHTGIPSKAQAAYLVNRFARPQCFQPSSGICSFRYWPESSALRSARPWGDQPVPGGSPIGRRSLDLAYRWLGDARRSVGGSPRALETPRSLEPATGLEACLAAGARAGGAAGVRRPH
jgi:hypothetical protein